MTSRIVPESPRAPTAREKLFPSDAAVSVFSSPSPPNTVTADTCSPKEPVDQWFLPWMLTASAPPSVTLVVPGTTGGHHPWPRVSLHSSSIVVPAYARTSGEECPAYTTCPHGACMQSIRLETVVNAVRSSLSELRAH